MPNMHNVFVSAEQTRVVQCFSLKAHLLHVQCIWREAEFLLVLFCDSSMINEITVILHDQEVQNPIQWSSECQWEIHQRFFSYSFPPFLCMVKYSIYLYSDTHLFPIVTQPYLSGTIGHLVRTDEFCEKEGVLSMTDHDI